MQTHSPSLQKNPRGHKGKEEKKGKGKRETGNGKGKREKGNEVKGKERKEEKRRGKETKGNSSLDAFSIIAFRYLSSLLKSLRIGHSIYLLYFYYYDHCIGVEGFHLSLPNINIKSSQVKRSQVRSGQVTSDQIKSNHNQIIIQIQI